MPGFLLRLRWELRDRIESDPRFSLLLPLRDRVRVRTRQGQSADLAWMGGRMNERKENSASV